MSALQRTGSRMPTRVQFSAACEAGARRVLRVLRADPDRLDDPDEGRWPTTRQTFLWDLSPEQVAPNVDGVIAPKWEAPAWLANLNDAQLEDAEKVLGDEVQRRRDSIAATEQKAARLLTPFVGLLTAAVALTAFQVAAIDTATGTWLFDFASIAGAVLGALGCAYLIVGTSRALDADARLSVSVTPSSHQILTDKRKTVLALAQGAEAAKFVQRNKANRILKARASISRALVFLVLSSSFGALGLLVAPSDSGDAELGSGEPKPVEIIVSIAPTSKSVDKQHRAPQEPAMSIEPDDPSRASSIGPGSRSTKQGEVPRSGSAPSQSANSQAS